ncbi:hypothetical protein [Flavobacterium psychrotrophum]|uniref:hypothetical protein n=1 Tax=Flavobacterium psychrotrophum TaxID=2294119 RepID=UPI0013C46716|nr:hypothetical protein [Flavobacterium psychrotrophum]
MKRALLIYILLFFSLQATAQTLYLKAEGKNARETKILDSVSYQKAHPNAKGIQTEANRLSTALQQAGYLESRITGNLKTNDSTFVFMYAVGTKTNSLLIYTRKLSPKEKTLLTIQQDSISISLADADGFMKRNLALLEQQGYPLSSLQLINYKKKGNLLTAQLTMTLGRQRQLDDIVLEGYPKFPEGIRRNILRQYRKKTFNKENLQRVYNDFNSLRFVTQPRYPEILFKQDTTKAYVYLEKAKPNTFDGFIGFSNDDQDKVRLNGYLDLQLVNVLNTGEKLNLYWKSDGNKQTTFNLGTELPYMFRSPIGAKASLKIFKQDSTFQNTVTDLNLGYYFNYNSKLYLGYQKTQSTDIQNTDSSNLSDYNSKFWTSTFDFASYSSTDFLFPQKALLYIKGGTGNRNSKAGNSSQYFSQINAAYNIYLNKKNIINIRTQNFYLKSNNYIVNELQYFGGINSIRGFNENSLQGNLYSLLLAEYRFVAAENIYIHTITDYGYYQDEAANTKNRLLGLGFGFGLLTNNGLFNIIYANGSTNSQNIKLSNSIVHISFKTSF